MAVFLLTDADRFPFDAEDRAGMADAGVELRELSGHEPEEVAAAAHGADAIFVYYARFPRETIARLEGVRVLARCGTGYDNIDVAAAREHGIEVVYVPDYGIDDVADHALALILRLRPEDRVLRPPRASGPVAGLRRARTDVPAAWPHSRPVRLRPDRPAPRREG